MVNGLMQAKNTWIENAKKTSSENYTVTVDV